MADATFDIYCPQCNILVEAKVIAEGSGGFRSNAISPIDEIDTEYHGDHYFVCLCRRCSQPFLIRQSVFGIPGEFETISDETILYPDEVELKATGLPENVKIAYDQAVKSLRASLFDPCVIMSRKCLEAVCKNHNIKGNNLNDRLQNLEKAGYIDTKLLNWANQIRLTGNEAAHDIDSPMAKEDARDVLDFTEAILIYVYSLNARFEMWKQRKTKT